MVGKFNYSIITVLVNRVCSQTSIAPYRISKNRKKHRNIMKPVLGITRVDIK